MTSWPQAIRTWQAARCGLSGGEHPYAKALVLRLVEGRANSLLSLAERYKPLKGANASYRRVNGKWVYSGGMSFTPNNDSAMTKGSSKQSAAANV